MLQFLGARPGSAPAAGRVEHIRKNPKTSLPWIPAWNPCCCLIVVNGGLVVGTMENERRNLVREIRKLLGELPADELFLITINMEQINKREESQIELGDEEVLTL